MPGQVERAVRLSGAAARHLALLAAGLIGPGHARAVVDGTTPLGDDPELLARVEARVLPRAACQTRPSWPGRLPAPSRRWIRGARHAEPET